MRLKNVTILGPGGNVGTAIITELLTDGPRFNITAITRETSTYTPPPDSNITHLTVDYASSSSLIEAFSDQDAIVNCVTGGATQYEPYKLIIDAAVAAGVKFFFANEFVGYVTSEQYKRLPEAVIGAKFRIREYLGQLAKEDKITWTSLNGGPFFDMWLMKGPAGFDVKNRRARIYGTGDNPLFWTPLPTIGLAAANMLRKTELIANRPVYICPITPLTQNIILDTLESVLNTKFTVEDVDVGTINKNARIALERGEVGKAMKGLTVSNQFYEGDCGNNFSHLVENEVVGVQTMSVDDAVKSAIAKYGEDSPVVEGMFRVDACEL
ncbi:NAD(P)-binding protein [Plenodomus tracheiphilus IPT5]|uniref:NAD(P)-binding protein n=1 Tax=Plenodomus tracheiphilus IPT5 TaxID=1408161 RepID=A0A6A7BEP9_9PLEO|nr:NAD(P)-binding protein [Plenodomus tracheiphilus IPT5]